MSIQDYKDSNRIVGKYILSDGSFVDVSNKDNYRDGVGYLRVQQREFGDLEFGVRYFTHDTFGTNMAVNGFPSDGSTLSVYDGTDHAYWTPSIINGDSGDFVVSTDQNHTDGGSKSLDFTGSEGDDIFQVKKSSGVVSTGSYQNLSIWIYLTSWDKSNGDMSIHLYNTITDDIVGSSVYIGDYINHGQFGSWQNANIPMEDLFSGSTDFDAIRIEAIGSAPDQPPTGYIDDIELQSGSGGGPYIYEMGPLSDETILISDLTYVMGSVYDGTLANSSGLNLSYDKFLNQTLVNGLLYRRLTGGVVAFSYPWKTLIDMLLSPGVTINNFGTDGVRTFMTIHFSFAIPAVLYGSLNDKIQIVVQDNLSGFDYFSVSAATRLVL